MGQLTELAAMIGAPAFVNGFVAVSLKAAVVLTTALAATTLLRRAPASTRHQVWALALVAVLALPALSLTLPAWQVAVLPPAAVDAGGPALPPPVDTGGGMAATSPGVETPGERIVERRRQMTETSSAGSAAPAPGYLDAARQAASEAPLGSLLLALWAVGFAYLLARLGVATLGAWWLVRRADEVTDATVLREAEAVRYDLGVTANVRVVHSDRISMPMAWGVLRATILMPREALEWSAERRRVVLLHEMAHLQRRDCLTLILARLVTALHWFNPLSWTATRRLQAERERACDDLVLRSGTAGADYAQHLLDIARSMRRDRTPSWATVAMARPSELEGRLLAILDPSRQRRSTSRATGVVALLAIGMLVLPLAALQPSAVAQEPEAQERMDEIDLDLSQQLRVDVDVRPNLSAALELQLPHALETGAAEGAAEGMAAGLAGALDNALEIEAQDAGEQGTVANERVMQAFATALQDEDASIRAQAANALGSMESEAAVDMLSAALRTDSDVRVRSQAAWALGMIESDAAIAVLAEALANDEDRVRKQAVWALGMIEATAAVQPLAAALNDEDAGIRSQAAWALGMIESPEALPGLIDALGDAEVSVRSQAAWALGMIEDAGAAQALSATLRNDDSAEVRKQSAWALGMIEDEGGLDALLDAMTDEDLGVRKTVLWAVGQISG